MRGPKSTGPLECIDRGDGSYVVIYSVNISGEYVLSVTLQHAHIAGSPFTLRVQSNVTQPMNCVAEGPGLREAQAGMAATFTIFKRDPLGRVRTAGVDRFYADVSGPGKWDCRMKDNKVSVVRVVSVVRAVSVVHVRSSQQPATCSKRSKCRREYCMAEIGCPRRKWCVADPRVVGS